MNSDEREKFVSADIFFKWFPNAFIIKSDIPKKKKMIPSQKHDCIKRMVVPVVRSVKKKSTALYQPSPLSISSLSRKRKESPVNGPVGTTQTRCLYKADAYPLKYVRFVQKKKQMNKIFFPPVDKNNIPPEMHGHKKELCLPSDPASLLQAYKTGA